MLLALLILLVSSLYLARQLAFASSAARGRILTVAAVGTVLGAFILFMLANNKSDYFWIASGSLAMGVFGGAMSAPFLRRQ